MKTRMTRFLHIILVVVLLASVLVACGDDEDYEVDEESPVPIEPTQVIEEPTVEPTVETSEPTQVPQTTPVPEEEAGTWLVMLYQNADDEILEKDIFTDLNEAEMVGSTAEVMVVAQLDRYRGAFSGDGDWTSTRRFLVAYDNDLGAIRSEELGDLGEVDSGDWNSLVDFVVWAIQTYPADKYALILSDHGAGWLGGWNDDDPVEASAFTTNDIDRAFREIIAQTEIGQFELIGFDACLMSQLEALYALVPYARVAVASEEVEPALGWAYAGFLSELTNDPAMSGAELGRTIVDSYIVQDGRITDDQARGVYVAEVYGYEGETTAEEVAEELMGDVTLTAVDLTAIPALNAAFNDLAHTLTTVDQSGVAEARAYAQSFENTFGDGVPPPYVDLGHFASLLEDVLEGDAEVSGAVQRLHDAIGQAVIAEKHGAERPGATGLSFYFPNSALYQATSAPDASIKYTAYASRFAAASLWDDFLLFHYTGQSFDPASANLTVLEPVAGAQQELGELETAAPPADEEIQAPGAGEEITIAPITLSAEEIGLEDSVTLATEISGDNVGYVYIYASYYEEEYDSFLTADMGFIETEEIREVGGIYYPDWGPEGVGALKIDWEPTIYFMSDGVQEEFAFFEPQVYGAEPEDNVYIVRGIYTFANSGNQRDAVMRFGGDGEMKSVYGFTDEDGTGAPREITPIPGDTFTILEEWLDFDQDPEGEFVDYEGGTLTFGEQRFEIVPYYAYPGSYVLGIIVEDMNGNFYEEFVEVTVTE